MTEKTINIKTDNIKLAYYQFATIKYKLNRNSDLLVLLEFDSLADDQGNFHLTTNTREMICNKLNLNKPNFSASLKRLIDASIILGEKGNYHINNDIFKCCFKDKIKLIFTLENEE